VKFVRAEKKGVFVIEKLTSSGKGKTGWVYDMVLCDECLENLINFIKSIKSDLK